MAVVDRRTFGLSAPESCLWEAACVLRSRRGRRPIHAARRRLLWRPNVYPTGQAHSIGLHPLMAAVRLAPSRPARPGSWS